MTVTDAAGRTGTTTRTLVVQNAGSPGGGTLRVFLTQPEAGTTVHGTTWFTIWVQGAAAGTKSYTLTQGGRTVASTTTASAGPVSLPWSTGPADNGARTATVTVRDAAGQQQHRLGRAHRRELIAAAALRLAMR